MASACGRGPRSSAAVLSANTAPSAPQDVRMKSSKRRREDGSRSQTAQKRARRFVPDVVQPELHLKMPSFAAPTMERFREDKPERDESDGEPDGHRFRHRRDLFSATSMYMTRLEKNITGQDFPSTFIDSMDEGVSLESQMSGLGAAELAGQCINGAVRKRHRRTCAPQTRAHRKTQDCPQIVFSGAADILQTRRRVLLNHGPGKGSGPHCVYGDFLKGFPKAVMAKLAKLHQQFAIKASSMIARGKPRKTVYEMIGRKFYKAATDVVFGWQGEWPDEGDCFRHKRRCKFNKPGKRRKNHVNVTGRLCFGWSSVGQTAVKTKMRKLQCFQTAALLLLWQKRILDEDEKEQETPSTKCAVVECTPGFDEQHSLKPMLSSGKFDMTTFRICPSNLKRKQTRMRKYVILRRCSYYSGWHDAVKHDPQAMFISLFAIKSDVGPAQYFGMPEAMLEECRERSAMAYGMSARQPNGKVWSSFQTLRSGCRRRLVGHETCLMQCGLGRANFVANLNQNSEHVPPGPHVPAFIRASVPWLFALRREGELPEMAEVQGFGPMFLASHYASHEHIQRPGDIGPTRELHDDSPDLEQEPCFFWWIRHNQLKDRDLRMGLGNAMVVGIIGAVVLYALACSVRHERHASG